MIVDLPIKDGDFPARYVSLPEGTTYWEKRLLFKQSTVDEEPLLFETQLWTIVTHSTSGKP